MNQHSYWRKRRALEARPPIPDPTPISEGNRRRMALIDSFPKPIRDAINYSTNPHINLLNGVVKRLNAGRKISTIIRWIEEQSLEHESRMPAEREAAQAFLKELGL